MDALKEGFRIHQREVRPFGGRLTIGPATPAGEREDIEAHQKEIEEIYARALKLTPDELVESGQGTPLWAYNLVSSCLRCLNPVAILTDSFFF